MMTEQMHDSSEKEITFDDNMNNNNGVDISTTSDGMERAPQQHESSMDVEQSLPTVAAITGRAEDEGPFGRRRRPWLVPGLLTMIVILLVVVIGLAVGLNKEEHDNKSSSSSSSSGNNNNGSSSSSGEQTMMTEQEVLMQLRERYDDIVRFLSDSGVSDISALQEDGSPQQLAATFMAELDPLLLEIPHHHEIKEGYTFVTRYVLTVLYFATKGDDWTNKRHFRSELPTCHWWEVNLDEETSHLYKYTGVICNEKGIITSLLLPDSNLEGPLPTELGLLTTMRSVVFNHNRLAGSIPESFQQLIYLENLWLENNQITGTLPSWTERYAGLKSLVLSTNRMEGALPPELGSLQHVEMIAVDNNKFSGRVDDIFNLQTISGLQKLRFLYMEGNRFDGSIGDNFMLSPNENNDESPLVALDLSMNSLTGKLPVHLFTKFPKLVVFDVSNNQLTGRLPENIHPNEALKFLALHNNQLSGEVSGLLPDLQQLTHLDVSSNAFTSWHIDLGALRKLSYLFLANNPFPQGPFPTFLSSLTNLQDFSMKSTQRTGTIPTFLGNMDKLVLLDLDDNEFTGTIPKELTSLSQLQFLLLNRNKLSGVVPSQLGDLTALRLLFLDSNDLSGDLDAICTDDRDPFVVADCAGSAGNPAPVSCFCCDECCSKDEPCNDNDMIPTHESKWQLEYQRVEYYFGGEKGHEALVETP